MVEAAEEDGAVSLQDIPEGNGARAFEALLKHS